MLRCGIVRDQALRFQYLLLVLYWWTQKPIVLTILPFATFSIFHIRASTSADDRADRAVTFVRTTFLPKPPAAAKDGKTAPAPTSAGAQLSKQIQTLVKTHYEHAVRPTFLDARLTAQMLFVSYIEILIMLRVIVGTVLRWNSFIAPILFAGFLRLRFYLSPATRKAFASLNARLDSALAHQSVPPAVRSGVNTAREMIIRFAQSSALPMPQGAAGAQAAPRPAGAAGGAGAGAAPNARR